MIIFETGLPATPPTGPGAPSAVTYALTHARIAHAGNWLAGGVVSAFDGSALLRENGATLLLEDGTDILLENRNNTAPGFFVDGPANSLTYERWKPNALPATWEYDHGAAASIDYCVIGAHDMGSRGATLEIQYWNGTAWIDAVPPTAITSDAPIMAIFARQVRQVWRIRIDGPEPAEIGVVKFGQALQMQRPLYGDHMPVPLARQTTLRSNMSETGEFLGRTRQRTHLATSYGWQHLTAAWVRENWPALQRAVEQEPFFIAWRPATFDDVALAVVDDVPTPANMGVLDLMSVQMTIRARGYD